MKVTYSIKLLFELTPYEIIPLILKLSIIVIFCQIMSIFVKFCLNLRTIQVPNQKSNPFHKEKNPQPKTSTYSYLCFCMLLPFATFSDFLRCFGCFEMFWETSCNQSKPQTKKPTQNTNKKITSRPLLNSGPMFKSLSR